MADTDLIDAQIAAVRKWLDGGCNSWGLPSSEIASVLDALAASRAECEGLRAASVRDVLAERRRQVEAEGWTPEHDDCHGKGEIISAAECYYLNAIGDSFGGPLGFHEGKPNRWPWEAKWWKPKPPRQDLVRAGALCVAERERIQRNCVAEGYMRQGGIRIEGLYNLILAEIDQLDRAALGQKEADDEA